MARRELMIESPSKTTLGVVFVQHDRTKYPGALTRLIRALDGLSEVETRYVVVDNALPGSWSHSVNERIVHVGGDNTAWEFSAFDIGIQWLQSQPVEPDLFLFSTDALLAYGERFLGLVDNRVFDVALEQEACVGWMDSFMEQCHILDYSYTTWIRTSLLIVPRAVLTVAAPMAWPLDDQEIFGASGRQPFQPNAPLSTNLQGLLLEWLTTNKDEKPRLDEVWHSQFYLDDSTLPLFMSKAKSILREHLLSARLLRAGVRCFDLRAVRAAQAEEGGSRVLRGAEAPRWQWLRWLDPSLSDLSLETDRPTIDPTAAPTFVVYHIERAAPTSANVSVFLAQEVLPLVRQRHARARLIIAGAVPSALVERRQPEDWTVLTPTEENVEPSDHGIVGLFVVGNEHPSIHHGFHQYLLAQGIPLIANSLELREGAVLHGAGGPLEPWSLAGTCCRAADVFFERATLAVRTASRSNS